MYSQVHNYLDDTFFFSLSICLLLAVKDVACPSYKCDVAIETLPERTREYNKRGFSLQLDLMSGLLF